MKTKGIWKGIIALTMIASIFSTSRAEDKPFAWNPNVGIYGGLNVNMQSPDINVQTQVFDENASDINFHFGIIGNYQLSEMISLTGRLGYNGFRGEFDNSTAKLKPSLDYLEFTPGVKFFNLFGSTPVYLLGALEFGFPMSGDYEMEVAGVNSPSEEIADKNFRLALALGVGYVFEVADNIYLSPEASFRIPFTDVSNNSEFDSWSIPQLRVGVALTFGFGDKKPEVAEVPGVSLEVGFADVRGYNKEKSPTVLRKVTLEETQYAELFPILPYVFFKPSESKPIELTNLEGKRQAGEFSLKQLPSDAYLINSQVLDLVGARMQENSGAKINLNGTLDGVKEKDTKLAQDRADFAKRYLIDNYSISAERISTSVSKTPSKASTSNDEDGISENRRVEISTSNSDILAPIMLESDRQRLADPDLVEFLPYAKSNEAIDTWELEIRQSGNVVRKFSGKGEPTPIQWAIVPNELKGSQVPLDYTFTAKTVSGASKNASGSVPVEFYSFTRKKSEDRADKTISKYSLMLFDFDSPNISDADKAVLNSYVIPSIKFNSTVQIYGYTDRIGEADYNKKLAKDRADAVKNFLQGKIKSAKYETFGLGEGVSIFDNNDPIGRQLSRTVQVIVITPKN